MTSEKDWLSSLEMASFKVMVQPKSRILAVSSMIWRGMSFKRIVTFSRRASCSAEEEASMLLMIAILIVPRKALDFGVVSLQLGHLSLLRRRWGIHIGVVVEKL